MGSPPGPGGHPGQLPVHRADRFCSQTLVMSSLWVFPEVPSPVRMSTRVSLPKHTGGSHNAPPSCHPASLRLAHQRPGCTFLGPRPKHTPSFSIFVFFSETVLCVYSCVLCQRAETRGIPWGEGGASSAVSFGGDPLPVPHHQFSPHGQLQGPRTMGASLPQAMSPDGEAIVTGAGDETLRFWNVFSKTRSTKVSGRCQHPVHPVCALGSSRGRRPVPPQQPLHQTLL